MAASSRTFLLGFDRSSMVFDKRPTPMSLETMHTFSFGSDEIEHLLDGTVPSHIPDYWEYRGIILLRKLRIERSMVVRVLLSNSKLAS